MSDNIAFSELSKRTDSNEKDIGILREGSHEIRNKLNQHENVIDRQGDVVEGLMEKTERLYDRVTKVEEVTKPLEIIKHSWKYQLSAFVVFGMLGAWTGGDVSKWFHALISILGKFT